MSLLLLFIKPHLLIAIASTIMGIFLLCPTSGLPGLTDPCILLSECAMLKTPFTFQSRQKFPG